MSFEMNISRALLKCQAKAFKPELICFQFDYQVKNRFIRPYKSELTMSFKLIENAVQQFHFSESSIQDCKGDLLYFEPKPAKKKLSH